jgi:hypothetical protein
MIFGIFPENQSGIELLKELINPNIIVAARRIWELSPLPSKKDGGSCIAQVF